MFLNQLSKLYLKFRLIIFVPKYNNFCDNSISNVYNIGTRPPPPARPPLPKKTENYKRLYPRLSRDIDMTTINMDPINPILPGINIYNKY